MRWCSESCLWAIACLLMVGRTVYGQCKNGVILDEGLTDAMKEKILDQHNKYRSCVATKNSPGYCFIYGPEKSQPGADYMYELEWDDRLADLAQKWVNKCVYKHESNANLFKLYDDFIQIGTSVAMHYQTYPDSNIKDNQPPFENFIQGWFNENTNFTYGRIKRGAASHYVQIVHANTYKVGCGYAKIFYRNGISSGDGNDVFNYGKYFSCYYGPAGNVVGEFPYIEGTPSCTHKYTTDGNYEGLCKKKVLIDGGVVIPV